MARSVLLAAALLSSCRRPGGVSTPAPEEAEPAGAAWFADVTDAVGLDFLHDPGTAGTYFMPGIIGSGAALADLDGDGRLDIYLLQNGEPETRAANRLFHQQADGRFRDATAGSGLGVAGRGMGVAAGDLTNDGLVDLLVTEYGGARLFINQGGLRFVEATGAGIDNPQWGTSAAFVDYDLDGWLDIAIANYVVYSHTRPCTDAAGRRDYCGPAPFPGAVARLFRNLGPAAPGGTGAGGTASGNAAPAAAPRFADVTVPSGLGRLPGPGLGIVAADFDGDRWPDLFVANDARPNHLWINSRDGTFREEAMLRGLAYNGEGRAEANMGIAVGDVNGDGLFDVFVTHLTEELHRLWVQGPRGHFLDGTGGSGLAAPRWRATGFGTVLADFDHDGDLDLALANGRVKNLGGGGAAAGGSFWDPFRERSQLFAGDGGKFHDVSSGNPAFCGEPAIARALAAGDIDGDGALDLLVTAVGGRARLCRNVAPARGHWLLVRAVDPALGGRDAYGATVTVRAGERRWTGLIQAAHSYLVANDPRAHFGLGAAERVDEVEVAWPDGIDEVFAGTAADRSIVLRRGEGVKRGGARLR